MDDDDWDLQAVVRGCGGGAAAATNPGFSLADEINSFDFLTDNDHNNSNVLGPFHGLQEAYRELRDDAPTLPPPAVSLPGRDHAVPHPARYEITQILKSAPVIQVMNNNVRSQENIPFGYNNGVGSSSSFSSVSSPSHNLQAQAYRQRRRKNQQMKVVRQMTQEQLSADSWAWRKYGQKPIKGSPYPRNYYRCSTSKGCAARKQVERSPNDPGLFVVSYAGEHTHPRPSHRSSLAGSTRTKSSTTSAVAGINNNDHDLFKPLSQNKGLNISSLSTTTTKGTAENDSVQEMAEDEEEDDDEGNTIFTIPNQNDDDMFKGFDDRSTCDGNLFPVTSPP